MTNSSRDQLWADVPERLRGSDLEGAGEDAGVGLEKPTFGLAFAVSQ